MDRDGVKSLVLVREGIQKGGGSPDRWILGKMDKLGHLAWSCLSGKKEYTKNEESL